MSAISELRVRSEAGAYRVRTGPGAFAALLEEVPGSFLVVDDHFAGHPSIDAERAVFLHATEDVKTLGGAETVIVGLRERGVRRGDRLVAVGGGIVQDVATLAAQLYMRGLPWSFVPTTLLAMADSCIGGKSSINVGPYKNLAGSFHPPDEVVVDPVFLQTLPDEDLAGGLAEALKITYCRGPQAFARHLELAAGFPGTAAPLIHHALESKRWFIEIDEFDRAERRLLNFGHTFGHALEAATGFGVSHGIAVALGVLAAERFAVEQGYGPGDEQLREQAAALAARAPDLDARVARLDEDAFARAFLADKKHGADGLHLILPVGDGVVAETVVPREEATMPAARRALTAAIGDPLMKYSDLLVRWLKELGYTHCFFVAGGNVMHLLDGVRKEMTCIPTVHEVAAGIAVEYFNEVEPEGRAFALVTAGPGLTNIVTAMAGAFLESRELLVLGGQVKSSDLAGPDLRQRGIQEIDGVAIAAPVSKAAVRIERPAPRHEIERLVALGRDGRPGPVFLELCLDAQGAPVEPADLEAPQAPGVTGFPAAAPPAPATSPEAAAARLTALLAEAQRPVLLLGGGVSRAAARAALPGLRRLGVPLMTTWNGTDRVPADEPLYAGRPNTWGMRSSNVLLQQADLVIALGTRLGLQQTGFNWQEFAPVATVAQVEIDPAELAKGHPHVDVPLQADAGATLTALAAGAPPADVAGWVAFCARVRELLPTVEDNERAPGFLDPYLFTQRLSELAGADDLIVPCSSGGAYTVTMQTWLQQPGQHFVTDKGLASMGYGLSGAIGAALAHPGRRTIHLEGDGGFAQNLQEIATVAVNGLPIKTFLFANEGYASIRMTQRNYFGGQYLGCDTRSGLGFPSWAKLFAAFDVPSLELGEGWATDPAFAELFAGPGPAAFVVPIDPEQTYFPKITSRVTADGSMASNPLHQMSPDLDDALAREVLVHTTTGSTT